MTNCSLFVGPMSKNIVDSVIEFANENDICLSLIPSRRQIDYDGGYSNNWTTKDFAEYVKGKTDKIFLKRDHGGPNQGKLLDDGIISLTEDCKYFDMIHIDPWKKHINYEDGLIETIKLINHCHNLNDKLYFEIGTEETIKKFDTITLDRYLSDLKIKLDYDVFKKIKYVVIQGGTSILGNNQNSAFDRQRFLNMIDLVRDYGLLSKEHNGDYQNYSILIEKFKLGLNGINIAPEFGFLETEVYLNYVKNKDKRLFDLFYEICYFSNTWKKWVSEDYDTLSNKEDIIKISGHYVFSNPTFVSEIKSLENFDEIIKNKIKDKIRKLYECKTKNNIL